MWTIHYEMPIAHVTEVPRSVIVSAAQSTSHGAMPTRVKINAYKIV